MGALKIDAEKDNKSPDSTDGNSDDVVLKLDMHCAGCVKKLKKVVRNIDGVAAVNVEFDLNKLTVTGKVDPLKLRELLAKKTNKKVDLISYPQPKKPDPVPIAAVKGEEKPAEKTAPPPEKPKAAEEAPKPKTEAPPPSTVVLKTKLHCDGCMQKIRKIVARFKGVQDVEIDGAKDIVTVTGTMDLSDLIPYLVEKLRRNVDVVPIAKKGDSGSEKKTTATVADVADGGGDAKKGDKKGKEVKEVGEEGGEVVKMEAQKMVYQPSYGGYNYNYDVAAAGPSSQNWYGGGGYGTENRMWGEGYGGGGGGGAAEEGNVGYVVEQFQYQNHHARPEPGMFSDENPNGCSVM
ncbi:unnamed protein product [Rhodiola kirilowii]